MGAPCSFNRSAFPLLNAIIMHETTAPDKKKSTSRSFGRARNMAQVSCDCKGRRPLPKMILDESETLIEKADPVQEHLISNRRGSLWVNGQFTVRVRGPGPEPGRIVRIRQPFALIGQIPGADDPDR